MLQRDKEGRFAPGGHVTSGCFSGTVISVLNKVKGGSGAGLCPAPATAPNPMLLGWTTGEATLPGNLDVLLAGLGCRLTFSRSGCRDGQQLKSGMAVGRLGHQDVNHIQQLLLSAAWQRRNRLKGFARPAHRPVACGWLIRLRKEIRHLDA